MSAPKHRFKQGPSPDEILACDVNDEQGRSYCVNTDTGFIAKLVFLKAGPEPKFPVLPMTGFQARAIMFDGKRARVVMVEGMTDTITGEGYFCLMPDSD